MLNTLVDSGPLIALFDRDDKHHRRVKAFLKSNSLRLVTTWPVLTETCAMLTAQAALDFLEFVERGGLVPEALSREDISSILALSRKYRDRPMDFSDASLVVLGANTGISNILSLDQDFAIYRLPGNKAFRNLLAEGRK